ncbi:MAG: LruC domain-containing protein, partial [Bacteroidetes bacterium]|nr:LruC domain-containing protein [Bacteroidota bacterium]
MCFHLMVKTMKFFKYQIITLALISSGCLKEQFENSVTDPAHLNQFLYETISAGTWEINFNTSKGDALQNVYFEIYTINPFSDSGSLSSSMITNNQMIYRGNSGKDGSVTFACNVPDYIDSLYLCPRFAGLAQVYVFPNDSTAQSITIGSPALYGSSDQFLSESGLYKSIADNDYTYLGGFNSQGLPNYLTTSDYIPPDLLEDINATLPEYFSLPQTHPQYLVEGLVTDMKLNASCEVWVTFVHEGAGWKNALGYYIYPLNDPPRTVSDIDRRIIIFPNASYLHSGGQLASGNKVKLKYFDPVTGSQSETFPAGTGIGWFLIADGFRNHQVTDGKYVPHSNPLFNTEPDENLRQHNVLLNDQERNLILLAFEDIRRDRPGCDNDFNDAVFYASCNPEEAADTSFLQPMDSPADTDGDGITNIFDNYPDDPLRAYNNYYPSNSDYGTFAFEDLWPYRGDYDFNDLIIDYRFNSITNSSNEIVELRPVFILKAIGGSFRNSFGFVMDVPPDFINSVTGQKIFGNELNLSANGTEANQSKAVIIVFDDAYKILSVPSGGTYVNTQPDDPFVEPDTISLVITLNLSKVVTDPLS